LRLEALEKLVEEFFQVDNFWEAPENKRPRNKIKARRMFFLFAIEFLNKTVYDLSEKYNIRHSNIRSDVRFITNDIETNVIVERQFNELKDALNSQKEPFIKSVDFEKGKQKGLELAIHAIKTIM
jgi:hypothetical protein